ncbi:MAG: four helix bundle protein [Synergistaceae bacterium]|nr:four helix bundle protein [Synergistaceae bacterium]
MDRCNMFHFQKLEIYQLAKEIAKDCYAIAKNFPLEEKFALLSQVYRAAISVPSNIAEGVSRKSRKDQIHFLNISYASLMELVCQLEISQEIGYIDEEDSNSFNTKANNLAVKMTNYMNYIKKLEE